MICLLHGYLLEGSGSNLWTRSMAESLCRQGHSIHLMAQENHPDRYPFITEARRYPLGTAEPTVIHTAPQTLPGRCILHKPELGDLLPVYVRDVYEEFPRVVPMIELSTPEIEAYVDRNVEVLTGIVRAHGITALHANHAVLMSVVAHRVSERLGIPFTLMPHGSALEFVLRRDERFRGWATDAFRAAGRIFVHGDEMRRRVLDALPDARGIEARITELHLGVDTRQFVPIARPERGANIARLTASLADTARGRTPEHARPLNEVHGGMAMNEMARAFAAAHAYDGKLPDSDLEARLAGIQWENDPILLYVGRLISTKGVHAIIVALPFLLERYPSLRLLLVGHGPLREPLEVLLAAMAAGDRALVEHIVDWGRALEGSPEGEEDRTELTQAVRYLDALRARGELDAWYAAAKRHLRPDSVIFTGYLTHQELRFLFPCTDVAIFPSVVKEAGPLVFLEAMASGAFPLGTYFGGMKASIDSVAHALPPGGTEAMKLSPDPDHTVEDIVRNVPLGLATEQATREALFRVARERYDWTGVAAKLLAEIEALTSA